MTVKIRSLLVTGPLQVPLSSGGTLRLSPGQVTEELADVEVTNNAKVDKLQAQRLIDVEKVGNTEAAAEDEAGGEADGQPAEKTPRRSNRSR